VISGVIPHDPSGKLLLSTALMHAKLLALTPPPHLAEHKPHSPVIQRAPMLSTPLQSVKAITECVVSHQGRAVFKPPGECVVGS
jgi:hypothetical protein